MRAGILLMGVLAVSSSAATAWAKHFEDLAATAETVSDLESIVSPYLQVCPKGNALEAVECRAIRRRMQRRVQGRLFRVVAEAVAVSPYDGAALRYWIRPLGCVTCRRPLKLRWGIYGGKDEWFFTVAEPKSVRKTRAGYQLVGIELTRHLKRGKKAVGVPVGPSDTEQWEHRVKPNLRVEFLVRVTPRTWERDGVRGLLLELVGYRLFNQCDGTVLASVPPSAGKGPIVKSPSCEAPAAKPVAVSPKKKIPDILDPEVIKRVMRAANPAVKECYDTYQIPGLARVRVVIRGSDGTVVKAEVRGKFKDTPTGKCILDKVQNLIFPQFRRKTMKFDFPFYLH